MPRTAEDWSYFRAGGVVQIELNHPEDLEKLHELDQKLWMALAMPTRGLGADPRTLDALDTDLDGRIRPPEIIAAISWYRERCHDLKGLLDGNTCLEASHLTSARLRELFHHLLAVLGKSESESLSLSDIDQALALLSQEIFNGDGVILPASSTDPQLAQTIQSLISAYQGVPDRSGDFGIDRTILQRFLSEREARIAWYLKVKTLNPQLTSEACLAAVSSFEAVAHKVDDYFTRCRWVAFDQRALTAANRSETDFDSIGKEMLHTSHSALNQLPLSHIEAHGSLPLDSGLNPAWQKAVEDLLSQCLKPLFAWSATSLDEKAWQEISNAIQPYRNWVAEEPRSPLSSWDLAKLQAVSDQQVADLEALINQDEAQEGRYQEWRQILTLALYRKDLGRILRNFINFSDFYRGHGALFQVGHLYLDGRRMELCIDVSNGAKHASIAGLSGAFLLYCECKRPGQPPRQIVALLTDGDCDNIMVGRNGVFYDSEGLDWDASVTRVVNNPISLREAFWQPYKSLARLIEDQISKRASLAQQATQADLTKTAEAVAHAEKKETADTASNSKSKYDAGTVAAIGVALGSIGTFLGVIFSKFIDLGIFMPFGILALLLLISGPSVVLAWLKLRHRNLAPILDANGWAINTSAKINVPFAASMTRLRTLPLHAGTTLPDPYAEAKKPWRFYTVLGIIIFAFCLWTLGKCDRILPKSTRAEKVLEKAFPQ